MTVTAEISFMVYGSNNVGISEKRVVEISQQDFSACCSSNRNENAQLMSWAKNLFPSAKKVTISMATKIEKRNNQQIKKTVSKNTSNSVFKTEKSKSNFSISNIILWIFFFPFKLIWWIIKAAWKY